MREKLESRCYTDKYEAGTASPMVVRMSIDCIAAPPPMISKKPQSQINFKFECAVVPVKTYQNILQSFNLNWKTAYRSSRERRSQKHCSGS